MATFTTRGWMKRVNTDGTDINGEEWQGPFPVTIECGPEDYKRALVKPRDDDSTTTPGTSND